MSRTCTVVMVAVAIAVGVAVAAIVAVKVAVGVAASVRVKVAVAATVGVVVFMLVAVSVATAMLVARCRKRNQKGSSSDDPIPIYTQTKFPTLTMDNFLNDMEREKPVRQQLRIATDNFTNLLGEDDPIYTQTKFPTLTMDNFLNDMEREKPIRFTSQQLRIATDNFTYLLGEGGFGSVYKGIFSNGTLVAVKVLKGTSDKRIIDEQFRAEVSTLGRIHHVNLVRLRGFCFEREIRALVYEYMSNGSLDKFLFDGNRIVGFEKLHDIAVGTARGIAYLHEECQQRIVHYDIKPENILLDVNFLPKVADFGLAKLCNRDKTHITMTGCRGTLGYAAPELYLGLPITHKCDVYSFGMLLFEIIGRRRNYHDLNLPESQYWFPRWGWKKFEAGELGELMAVSGIEEKDREAAERMLNVAIWCVQYRSELRPLMSVVVKMLEGAFEIPRPSINPFQHLMPDTPIMAADSSQTITGYNIACETPIMKKYEIEIAST